MFQLLLDMYVEAKINDKYLNKAVRLGWITADEMNTIIEFKKESDLVESNN